MIIGRNDPCHCGSGKKYKKCCLSKEETRKILPVASLEEGQKNEFLDPMSDHGKELHGSPYEPIKNPIEEVSQYIPWEYSMIERAVGGFKRLNQSLIEVNGKFIDRIIVVSNGIGHVFYFDVTEQLAKLKSSANAALS